jgi:hypothetical protein
MESRAVDLMQLPPKGNKRTAGRNNKWAVHKGKRAARLREHLVGWGT